MNDEKLATELLHELKASAHRWFIIALVEFLAIVAIIVIYLVVPEQAYKVDVDNDDGNATYIGRDLGGDLYNGERQGELQEESK